MKASELLFAADKLYDTIGWCRGNYYKYDHDGNIVNMCVAGALQLVCINGGFRPYDGPYEEAYNALGNEFNPDLPSVTAWNDNVAKDKKQVRQKLRKVARALEKLGR